MSTRERILDAAATVMTERGIARATTKEIARAAGCSEALLYKHFTGKQEIFLGVLRERVPPVTTPGDLTGTRTVRENLETLVRELLTFYVHTYPIAASMLGEAELLAAWREGLRERDAGPHVPAAMVEDYLRKEQRIGRLPPSADPWAMAALLVGATMQQAFLATFAGRTEVVEPVTKAARLVDAVLAESVNTAPYHNPGARSWRTDRVGDEVIAFHRSLPGYAQTRLVSLPAIADELGVANVVVKEESARFGLPAFKILGASYAISRALSARHGHDHALPLNELRALISASRPIELIAATDGNHGRAVAYTARLLGLPSRIFTPVDITEDAKRAIAAEGAATVDLALPYDDVVRAAAAAAEAEGDGALLVQDTSWTGYEQIPQWIVDGYSTVFDEVAEQLSDAGIDRLDVVVVPVGVGSLAQAAVRHYRSGTSDPSVVSVEPEAAPAVIASLHAGRPVTVGTGTTIMAGLNCGTPSQVAWPTLRSGLDAAVVVTDDETTAAVHDLADLGVDSGPCGAAALAGVRTFARESYLPPNANVLLLSTESRSANPLPERDGT